MNTENETREPFDLEKALAGEPVETRDGRKVTDLKFFESAKENHSIAGILDDGVLTWTKTGSYYIDGKSGCTIDLFMSPKPKVIRYLWVNPNNRGTTSKMYSEKEAEEELSSVGYFIKIPGTATEFPD